MYLLPMSFLDRPDYWLETPELLRTLPATLGTLALGQVDPLQSPQTTPNHPSLLLCTIERGTSLHAQAVRFWGSGAWIQPGCRAESDHNDERIAERIARGFSKSLFAWRQPQVQRIAGYAWHNNEEPESVTRWYTDMSEQWPVSNHCPSVELCVSYMAFIYLCVTLHYCLEAYS
jgi:hypothetical protein